MKSRQKLPSLYANEKAAYSLVFGDCLPHKDATRDITIFVNEKDVQEGDPKSYTSCAIALATQHAIGPDTPVMVLSKVAYVGLPTKEGIQPTRYMLSEEAQMAVYRNDKGLITDFNLPVALIAPRGSYTLKHRRSVKNAATERKRNGVISPYAYKGIGRAEGVKKTTRVRKERDPDIRDGSAAIRGCRV